MSINPYNTETAWTHVMEVIDNPNFTQMDDQLIYDTLLNNLQIIPFCDYLKRYLHAAGNLPGSWDTTDPEIYRMMIVDSFRDNATPPSFTESTVTLRAIAGKWLVQQTAKRPTAFLLGFGLKLDIDEVNRVLMKGLRLQCINPLHPKERCASYCFHHGYSFPKYEALMARYNRLPALPLTPTASTVFAENIPDDETLLHRMQQMKNTEGESYLYVAARTAYTLLYDLSRDLAADIQNNVTSCRALYKRENIGPRDLEQIISSAIPVSRNGNLIPCSESTLGELFRGRHLNRQRITEVLSGRVLVDRFDLLTLLFFLFASGESIHFWQDDSEGYPPKIGYSISKEEMTPRKRFDTFSAEANQMLRACGFGPTNPSDPYEAFLLMCILSDAPLSTYADVWERAYSEKR